MLRDKGIHELAEAISLISQRRNDVQFWLLGELDTGNPAAISEAELAEILKNPTVKHLGTTPDPRPFLAACDCLVLPSYREGLPRASLEAMSMAKPIVTTDVPGCRDTVEEGRNGFLVPVQDGPGLAAGLEKFLQKTAAERAEMGEFSRRKALAEFDLRIVQQRYLAILASLNPTKTT